ncbi:hypothetical protein [Bacillus kwashiorkori]|uniref:hypothetical protein n=1 Tax=Bacillus kwashiorkori TaxID=1522318 RepID=UPI0007834B11|nr:hypothetical protein [Bacillus kwashiorkori]
MNTYTVTFHKDDMNAPMTIHKYSEEDFDKATTGGTRQLFELDTNFGFFIFLDAEDNEGKESFFALRYEEEEEVPSDYYRFELKDFYDMMALFMSQMYVEDEEEADNYGPIHHLAHLLHHIVEDGQNVQP